MTNPNLDSLRVRDAVRAILADVLGADADKLRDDALLVEDLKVDGDDFSFLVVPMLERELGVSLKGTDWSSVLTVADLERVVAGAA
jgi:acyl carrier protein